MVNKCQFEAPETDNFVVDIVVVVNVVVVALLVVTGHIIFIVVNECKSGF